MVNGIVSHHKARQGMMKVEVEVDGVTPLHREKAKEKSPERVGWGLVARGGRNESPILGGLNEGGDRQVRILRSHMSYIPPWTICRFERGEAPLNTVILKI
jgi:hypothetical protein